MHAKNKKQEKKAWWKNRIRPHEGYHYSACTYYMQRSKGLVRHELMGVVSGRNGWGGGGIEVATPC